MTSTDLSSIIASMIFSIFWTRFHCRGDRIRGQGLLLAGHRGRFIIKDDVGDVLTIFNRVGDGIWPL